MRIGVVVGVVVVTREERRTGDKGEERRAGGQKAAREVGSG